MPEPNGNHPLIEVKELRKSFGDQTVLNGINLAVRPSETIAILGRSGTGKSVLLKVIIGLMKPDSGSIRICSQEITGMSPENLNGLRRRIGFLFQHAALYDSLTIEENVEFPLKYNTAMTREERAERARELLSLVNVEGAAGKMPSEVSGGMKKRIGLARALALDPEILLLDEPTAELDPITAGEIQDLLIRLREKKACVLVTHDTQAVERVADRVALLDEGNIVAEGTVAQLGKSHSELVRRFMQ